jgi:hypothetical protein
MPGRSRLWKIARAGMASFTTLCDAATLPSLKASLPRRLSSRAEFCSRPPVGLDEETRFDENIFDGVEAVDRAGITKKVAELAPIGNIRASTRHMA